MKDDGWFWVFCLVGFWGFCWFFVFWFFLKGTLPQPVWYRKILYSSVFSFAVNLLDKVCLKMKANGLLLQKKFSSLFTYNFSKLTQVGFSC